MKITVTRLAYTPESTAGIMCLEDRFFGYTLEDYLRTGPKVPGKTAIPQGTYDLRVTFSERFGKYLPLLIDVPGFEGVRIHGGNTAEDTLGCILLAERRVNVDRIAMSLSTQLVKTLELAGGTHQIQIINAWRPEMRLAA